MTTKAIHLELVSDLTSDAFIAALKRFIARRGIPDQIFSDNGTNFRRASSTNYTNVCSPRVLSSPPRILPVPKALNGPLFLPQHLISAACGKAESRASSFICGAW